MANPAWIDPGAYGSMPGNGDELLCMFQRIRRKYSALTEEMNFAIDLISDGRLCLLIDEILVEKQQ
jgi:hypothetical protein